MRISLLSTGDEILRGDVVDTNSAWLAKEISSRGFRVSSVRVLGDDLNELSETIALLLNENDLVFVGGGLGPTEDDLTARAAAEALGVNLTRFDSAAKMVKARFDRIGVEMNPVNLKQADLPEGCTVLENPAGTAPGFAVDKGGAKAVFFPGVPREMKAMFELHADDFLPRSSAPGLTSIFKCFGVGESMVQADLNPLHEEFCDLKIAFRASFPEIGVRITAKDEATLAAATARAKAILKGAVFSRVEERLPEALFKLLAKEKLTISTAESCTGGLMGHLLTEIPGSSACFRGGVVAYDNEVKIGELNVPREIIEEHGAVSEQTVTAMAKGARTLLETDLAMATSGVAGPDGGTDEKPVGTVHIAVATPNGTVHRKRYFKGYARSRVKTASAWTAMKMAFDAVSEMK